jgi:hypothetical protein
MQKFLIDFIKRLSSRKFLITIGGIMAVISFPERAGEIVTLTVTFVAAEGVGDAAERYNAPKVVAADKELEATRIQVFGSDAVDTGVDKTEFVPGGMSGQ